MEPANATHQFSRADAILEDALDLPDGERDVFAAGRCDGDGTLCAEVLRLLAFARKQDDFLERPPHAFGIGPGDLLGGRFRIKEKLGEGGMGAVFLADDAQLGEVALKTIRMEMRGDRRAMERFRAEIRLGRSVSHRNVCPVFDLFTLEHPSCGGLAAFTMKYVRGETLAARISRGRMPVTELLPVARGIAAGLDALHAEGIVHCDLKPANILLATGGNGEAVPVITDFGLARRDDLRPGEG
ncbi:MAG: serine/threonine-protein kinase, partial [Bryobacteraceae bacterium]